MATSVQQNCTAADHVRRQNVVSHNTYTGNDLKFSLEKAMMYCIFSGGNYIAISHRSKQTGTDWQYMYRSQDFKSFRNIHVILLTTF